MRYGEWRSVAGIIGGFIRDVRILTEDDIDNAPAPSIGTWGDVSLHSFSYGCVVTLGINDNCIQIISHMVGTDYKIRTKRYGNWGEWVRLTSV